MKTVVIVGAGVSGLATAALLGKLGWRVIVLEKNSSVGGRARVLTKKGFSFDMGPSWYLMPEVFEQFFAHFGKSSQDFFSLVRLNPRYQVIFADGQKITLPDNLTLTADLFEQLESGAAKKLRLWLARNKNAYEAVVTHLLSIDLWKFSPWLQPQIVRAVLTLLTTFRPWESWTQEVRRHFRSEKLKQILSFPAVFLGGSPMNTPSFYSILAWADIGKGVWYPKGGMGKVIQALEKLAQENGAEIHTREPVTHIEVERGKVIAVRTRNERYLTDTVVAATDIPYVETHLLPRAFHNQAQKKWDQKTLGISALLLYLGINKKLPNVPHHTIVFSENWEKNFSQILQDKTLPTDASLYISARTATDNTIAPKHTTELFVLVPLAAKLTYTQNELSEFSQKIIERVEQKLAVKLQSNLVVKEIFTPQDFYTEYNAYQGTALGLAHTLKQSLWMRSRNKHPNIQGLFYAGQYTNPGVGVPMALLSAQLVARMLGEAQPASNTIFRNGSKTYYYSSIFFRGQVKQDVFDLYAYVRTIDNLVDCEHPQASELDRYWKLTTDTWHGKMTPNRIVQNFVDLAHRHAFQWEWIESFWQAMRQDLTKKRYNTTQELDEYIYGSAEVIGYMMSKILSLPEQAMTAAALQGKAMQLVNFIRDVGEDRALGRNYLGYTEQEREDPEVWSEFIRDHIARYSELQRQAEAGYQYIPKKYLIPIKTAAQMYTWTAQQIYKDPELVWHTQVKPRKGRVLWQLMKNMVTT